MDITLSFVELDGVPESMGCILDFGDIVSKYSFS
jgi:hypothetical protein